MPCRLARQAVLVRIARGGVPGRLPDELLKVLVVLDVPIRHPALPSLVVPLAVVVVGEGLGVGMVVVVVVVVGVGVAVCGGGAAGERVVRGGREGDGGVDVGRDRVVPADVFGLSNRWRRPRGGRVRVGGLLDRLGTTGRTRPRLLARRGVGLGGLRRVPFRVHEDRQVGVEDLVLGLEMLAQGRLAAEAGVTQSDDLCEEGGSGTDVWEHSGQT